LLTGLGAGFKYNMGAYHQTAYLPCVSDPKGFNSDIMVLSIQIWKLMHVQVCMSLCSLCMYLKIQVGF